MYLLAQLAPEATWFTAKVIWGVLWGGLALITISILILMQTRWGQAKPMSKCVVLSIFAHVMLIFYAHTTQIFEPQAANHTKEVNFTLSQVDFTEFEDETPQEEQQEEPRKQKPWETIANSSIPTPEVVAPDRKEQATQPKKEIKAELPGAPKLSTNLPEIASDSFDSIEEPTTKPEFQIDTKIKNSIIAAKKIEPIKPKNQTESEPTSTNKPKLPELAKADIPSKSIETSNSLSSMQTIPKPKKLENKIQSLTDAVEVEQPADALAAMDNQLEQTENRLDQLGEQNQKPQLVNPKTPRPPVNQLVSQAKVPVVMPSEQDLLKEYAKGSIPLPETDRKTVTALPLPLSMQGRVAENQRNIILAQGGDPRIEASIDAALLWLASNQLDDGRWDASQHGAGTEQKNLGHDRYSAGANADSGITALAVLAFLGKGHTHLEGKYRTSVQHGLEFIVNHQAASGSLAGEARLYAQMYCHGMAMLAVCEAYAMTRDQRLRPYLEKAIQYSIKAQHPVSGGWRYQPGDMGDMSQFGWQVMALHSAKLAGIEIPDSTHQLMVKFLRSASSGQQGGLGSYRKGERVTASMTAEALVCRLFLQELNDEATLNEAASYLSRFEPQAGKMNLYYWYYATLGLHQMQDKHWQSWSQKLQSRLMASQVLHGQNSGSWSPDTEWGNYGGRVYSTALATLSLEVYVRYLPLYREPGQPNRLPLTTQNALPIRIIR